MRKNFISAILLLSALFLVFTIGCKRESVLENPIIPVPPTTTPIAVNDLTQVTASVSGIVLDESNAPIASAVVTSGAATTTTNSNGMFIFQNISLSKENGSVTVVKAGYFKGVRSFKTTAGKNHTVRLQLMQKVLSGTVNASTGGTINSNGGATIVFPAAAFVTSTGTAYTGTVNVYSRWINPTAANLPFIIPGDLRGVGRDGAENILETYGMVGAELEDASGNSLKIATGKKATISFPLPTSLQASAPATIQLWHFDDATARWKENGTATKTGNTYSAQVDKFSFWNVDVGSTNFINLDYTLMYATTNSPLVSTTTRIKRNNGSIGYGITNNFGFISGLVPKNEALILEVVSSCNTIIYTQNIGPFNNNVSLGNIVVAFLPSQSITFNGTILNCNGSPVSNGYISFFATGGYSAVVNTDVNGAFSFSILNCSGNPISYNYQGADNITSQLSSISSGSSINGVINLGNINACGVLGNTVYAVGYETNSTNNNNIVKLWKNGIVTNITNGVYDAVPYGLFVSGTDVYAVGREYNGTTHVAKIWKNGIVSTLSNSFSQANSVFVSGADIYVAGYETNASGKNVAKIWKNGVATNLTDGTKNANTRSIVIVGTDVYVAGEEENNVGTTVGKLWKNGVASDLLSGAYSTFGNSIKVVGTDVYVAGRAYISVNLNKAITWKNGVATNLTGGIKDASVTSIDVSGSDVYASGYEYDSFTIGTAKFWKNGIATSLTNGTNDASTGAIVVRGTDIYVGGGEKQGSKYVAKTWKNGLPTILTDGTNNAFVMAMTVN